jgi:hypothetical protein
MENFISGYPCNEEAQGRAITKVLGPELAAFFFEKFLENFFTAGDADYLASLGVNHVRIPLNYRHFEGDSEPMVIRESGYRHLDRAVNLLSERGIYSIIDLHALPGYQNQDWHSDNPTHKAFFWQHRHFQDRAVNLWENIARRYRDNPWVAGYNPINEPGDPTGEAVAAFYERVVGAIRAVDSDHLIFLEANRYSLDTDIFDGVLPGVVYSIHDYPGPGQVEGGPYPGVTAGRHYDKSVVEGDVVRRIQFMIDSEVPVWVGEFGPVYTGDPEKDEMRYRLLCDQIEIYEKYGASWALWTYKDIGIMGPVFAKPDSPYVRRIRPFLEKQDRLGAGGWKTLDTNIRSFMGPLEELFAREFPGYDPFPFGAVWQIRRLIRGILLSEPFLREWSELFRGATEDDIEEMMESFRFENCAVRTGLEDVLIEACRG